LQSGCNQRVIAIAITDCDHGCDLGCAITVIASMIAHWPEWTWSGPSQDKAKSLIKTLSDCNLDCNHTVRSGNHTDCNRDRAYSRGTLMATTRDGDPYLVQAVIAIMIAISDSAIAEGW
jgi:hypothetical protein